MKVRWKYPRWRFTIEEDMKIIKKELDLCVKHQFGAKGLKDWKKKELTFAPM